MDVVRRFSLLATTMLLGIAVMLGWATARPAISADSATQLVGGTAYFDSTIVLARNARPVGGRGDELTVALGYLERLRLGLGSPFRLVDEALHDPRIDSTMEARVSWALLGRLRRGEAYAIDPSVLDGAGPWSTLGHGATGAAHLALIEHAISRASDPRAGELAVRLAYMIEAAKGTLAASAPTVAVQVAALVRDRELAAADLGQLLSDAAVGHEDALAMLVRRRAARAFRVEQPAMAELTPELRTEAMNAVPALLAALDTLDRATAVPAATASLLGSRFGARLAELGQQRPPIAQVIVTLRGHAQSGVMATNDETLAAASAARPRWGMADSSDRGASLAVLASAVALRAYNQSAPWFPGDPGPAASALVAEFGLGSVKFARTVPLEWRPYYLRELRTSLRDLADVFPALSVSGLNVAIGTAGLPDSALAMHDPRSRTLQLTISTSSGTLAHELAHDLDWQTSRRIFAGANGYSTDRAVRERPGTLASSVRGLAEARSTRPLAAGSAAAALSDRPAELFARGVDWFTATALAMNGRTNAFLTAVQDAELPGYAAGPPSAVGEAGTTSLLSAIDQMTFIDDSTEAGFVARWSNPSSIDPVLAVRRVLATPVPRSAFGNRSRLASMLPWPRASLCVSRDTPEARARDGLLEITIEARARGIAARRARYRFPGGRSDLANGLLGVPPWSSVPAAALIASLESALVGELRAASSDQGVVDALPASFRSSDASCSAIVR